MHAAHAGGNGPLQIAKFKSGFGVGLCWINSNVLIKPTPYNSRNLTAV